jgi:predicted TIM-barrel fold metal-dependent hydrolase
MHASDYPFNSAQDFAARDFLSTATLSGDDHRKVAHENWNTILDQMRRQV